MFGAGLQGEAGRDQEGWRGGRCLAEAVQPWAEAGRSRQGEAGGETDYRPLGRLGLQHQPTNDPSGSRKEERRLNLCFLVILGDRTVIEADISEFYDLFTFSHYERINSFDHIFYIHQRDT